MTQLDRAPYKGHRRVIDVSGDGDNNSGREPTAERDVAIARGITINGLVILTEPPSHSYSSHTNPPGGLANYYRNNVIGGAGAFVAVAENFNSFVAASMRSQRAKGIRDKPIAPSSPWQNGFAEGLIGSEFLGLGRACAEATLKRR